MLDGDVFGTAKKTLHLKNNVNIMIQKDTSSMLGRKLNTSLQTMITTGNQSSSSFFADNCREKINSLPAPSVLITLICSPWQLIISFTIESPRPVLSVSSTDKSLMPEEARHKDT